jgi:DNA-directed RNA polymerase sigma subunit (sigma70/sigma32)
MEKPKPQEEKQMNRIKKADKRKTQKNKGDTENLRIVISTAACSGTERPFPP